MKDESRNAQSSGKQSNQSNVRPDITLMSERGKKLAEKSAPRSAFDVRPSGGER